MKCPTCENEMEDGRGFDGEWAHLCQDCGTMICVDCGFVMKSLNEADSFGTSTGFDYFCPECERGVYSVDLYPE